MKRALGESKVSDDTRITIRRGSEEIQTQRYFLTYNKPIIPRKVKIGCCLKKVEKYILAHLMI